MDLKLQGVLGSAYAQGNLLFTEKRDLMVIDSNRLKIYDLLKPKSFTLNLNLTFNIDVICLHPN